MSEITEQFPPVAPGIFTLPPYNQHPPCLLGGYCAQCNKYYFPRPVYCRSCQEPTKEIELGTQGQIYSYTVIRTKAPLGLPTPYGVAYIDLVDVPLRIFCLIDPAVLDDLKVGMKVQLAVGQIGHDGQGSPCLRPYFTCVKCDE